MESLTRYLRLKVEEEIAIPLEQVISDSGLDKVARIQVSLDRTSSGMIHVIFCGKVFQPSSTIDNEDGTREVFFSFEKVRDGVRFRQCFLAIAGPVVIRRVSVALKRPHVLMLPVRRSYQKGGTVELSSLVRGRSFPSGSRLRISVTLHAKKDLRCRIRTKTAEGVIRVKKRAPDFQVTYETKKKQEDNRLVLSFSEEVYVRKGEVTLGPPSKGKTRAAHRKPVVEKTFSRDHLFLNPYDESLPLFFHHVPKTAGSSLTIVLEEWFGDSHYSYYADMKLGTAPLRMRLAPRTVVSGHFSRSAGLALDLHSAAPQRITLLRDPFELIVSNYFFTKWEGIGWHAPPPTLGKSLNEELDRVLRGPNDIFFNFLPARPPDEPIERWVRSNFLYIGLSSELQNCVDDLAVLLGRRALIAPMVNQSIYDGAIPDLRKEVRAKFAAEYELYDLVKEWHDSA